MSEFDFESIKNKLVEQLKSGVILWGISRDNAIQGNLFNHVDRENKRHWLKLLILLIGKMAQ